MIEFWQDPTPIQPCPFCGAEAELDTQQGYRALAGGAFGKRVAIYCSECPADMGICREDVPEATVEQLVVEITERWNTRPRPSPWRYPERGDPMPEEGQEVVVLFKFRDREETYTDLAEYDSAGCSGTNLLDENIICFLPIPKREADSP